MRAGEAAYLSGKPGEALDSLRIACFGLLDQTELLAEGLVFLTLAQIGARHDTDADETVGRFLEVEQRFGAYEKAAIPPELRRSFEEQLVRRVAPERLAALPTLSRLVETTETRLARLPPKERVRALEDLTRREPANLEWPMRLAREAEAMGEPRTVLQWTARALSISPTSGEALVLSAKARMARREWTAALADFRALAPDQFAQAPALHADFFVAAVFAKDWAGARQALPEIPSDLRARADVRKAEALLPREPPTPVAPVPSPVPTTIPEPTPAALVTVGPTPPAANALSVTTNPPPPTPPSLPPGREEAVLAEADRLRREGKAAEAKIKLERALTGAPPSSGTRALRKLLLEVSYLSKDWKLAAAQVSRIEPFVEGEEPAMFYAAVALFETGSREAAKILLNRARPRLQASAFIDSYARRILGGS